MCKNIIGFKSGRGTEAANTRPTGGAAGALPSALPNEKPLILRYNRPSLVCLSVLLYSTFLYD